MSVLKELCNLNLQSMYKKKHVHTIHWLFDVNILSFILKISKMVKEIFVKSYVFSCLTDVARL